MLSRVSSLLLRRHSNAARSVGRAFGSTKFAAGGGHHGSEHASHSHGDHGHSSHGHHADEPHVPEFYDRLGKFMLITTYLWVFYRLKEDKGQLFGYYQPWLHEHHHEEHEHDSVDEGAEDDDDDEVEAVEDDV